MALFVRADASPRIGTGHVMRGIALVQHWVEQGGEATFLSHEMPRGLARRCENEKIPVLEVSGEPGSPGDAREVLDATGQDAWIVLDGYDFGSDYQSRLRARRPNLMVVDDMAHHPRYDARIVLNQNPHAHALHYEMAPGTSSLFGPRYALLRSEFTRRTDLLRGAREPPTRVLVTLGGADPENRIGMVLQSLFALDAQNIRVRALLGATNPHWADLESRFGGQMGGGALELISDPQDVPSHMEWADLAISAAGSTVYELAYLGRPFIVGVIADNQVQIAQALADAGAAVNVGRFAESGTGRLTEAIRVVLSDAGLRRRLSVRARGLVDGRGAARVVEAMSLVSSEVVT